MSSGLYTFFQLKVLVGWEGVTPLGGAHTYLAVVQPRYALGFADSVVARPEEQTCQDCTHCMWHSEGFVLRTTGLQGRFSTISPGLLGRGEI